MMDSVENSSYHMIMICYVKGNWVEESQAHISIDERGFRFGDGVFETILVKAGKAQHIALHLERLSAGLAAIRIHQPSENFVQLCTEIITKNSVIEGILRLSVSRGIGSRGYLPHIISTPTVIIQTLPMPDIAAHPLTLWLSSIYKPSAKSLPTAHKLMQGLNSTLARMEAADNQCDEALMLNLDNEICEASSATIFWRDDMGIIHTPKLDCGTLDGIGRKILIQRWQGKIQEGRYTTDNLRQAKSVFIINAITGPQWVKELQPLGIKWSDASLADEAKRLWLEA